MEPNSDNIKQLKKEITEVTGDLMQSLERMRSLAEGHQQINKKEIIINGDKCTASHSESGIVIITFTDKEKMKSFFNSL